MSDAEERDPREDAEGAPSFVRPGDEADEQDGADGEPREAEPPA